MPWHVIHGRERALMVSGADAGHPIYTRDPSRALRFDSANLARQWIASNTQTAFGALALRRANPINENGAESGQEQRRREGQTDEVYGIESP